MSVIARVGDAIDRVSRRRAWETAFAATLLLYYAARLVFFATNISPQVPPDETTHVGIARLYAGALFSIEDSPASYAHGLVTRVPFLYHLLMGKLLALDFFGVRDYLFLRFVNLILAWSTALVAYRLALRVVDDGLARLLALVMVTNTLMQTFLGASVSYDNLVNLLAALSVYSLVAYLQGRGVVWLAGMSLWCLLGALTKLSFLPLPVVLTAIVLIERRLALVSDLKKLGSLIRERHVLAAATLAAVAAGAVLCVVLYGGNLARYGRLVPACDQVLPLDACMQNRIFARNFVVNQFRKGEWTIEEAMQATLRISHPGDRDHAVRLLRNELAFQRDRPAALPRFDYVFLVWNQAMKPTIFGIQAHLSMLRDPSSLLPYNLILLAAFLLWVRRVDARAHGRPALHLAVVALFYFLFLVGYYNYGVYSTTHAPFLGVQGRYVLPVLVPAYLVVARSLVCRWHPMVRLAVVLVVGLVFVAGDLPYFLRHVTAEWYLGGAAP